MKALGYATSLNKRLEPIVCRASMTLRWPELLRAHLNFIFFDEASRVRRQRQSNS